jgi:hypothetical protein
VVKFKKLLGDYKHFFILLLYVPLYMWFLYLEKTIVPKYYMFSPFDLKIPFVKEFVVPYLFWYIYMVFGFIYLGIVSKKDYYKMFWFIFIGMFICYCVYSIFPNGQNLRPTITGNDIFSRIVDGIYTIDTPTNVAPSMHVLNSIAIHIGLTGYEPFKKRLGLRLISLILMVIISVSTVFVKQHSILDGLWAIALSIALYIAIYSVSDLIKKGRGMGKGKKKTIMSME